MHHILPYLEWVRCIYIYIGLFKKKLDELMTIPRLWAICPSLTVAPMFGQQYGQRSHPFFSIFPHKNKVSKKKSPTNLYIVWFSLGFTHFFGAAYNAWDWSSCSACTRAPVPAGCRSLISAVKFSHVAILQSELRQIDWWIWVLNQHHFRSHLV